MSIELTCVQCGTTHHVNARLAGRRMRCPNCDTAVHVPEQEAVVEVEAEPELADVEPIETLAPIVAVTTAAAPTIPAPSSPA